MAVLYVSEYAQLANANGQVVAAGQEPARVEQSLAISGASNPSAAFGASTQFVRLHTDVICSVLFGAAPTAVTTAKRMAAGQTEFFGVVPGQKVAVILNT